MTLVERTEVTMIVVDSVTPVGSKVLLVDSEGGSAVTTPIPAD